MQRRTKRRLLFLGGIVIVLCLGCSCLGILGSPNDVKPSEGIVSVSSVTPLQSLTPTSPLQSSIIPTPPEVPEPTLETSTEENVYYKNCKEAREAGAAPIMRGDPGYRKELDADGDGIACEYYRR